MTNLHLETLNAESVDNVLGNFALGQYDAGEVAEIKALGLPIVFVELNMLAFDCDSVTGDYAGHIAQNFELLLKVGIDDIGFLGGLETSRSGREQLLDVRTATFDRVK